MDPDFFGAVGLDTMFFTAPNELHRRRRAPLNAFFSRRSVLELEDVVQGTARQLCEVVVRRTADGGAVDLGAGMRAVSVDVITRYAFDEG